MKKSLVIFLRNLKDIVVISNCAKIHPKIRWNKGSNLRVKFAFYTATIKMTELGRMSRGEVIMSASTKIKGSLLLLTKAHAFLLLSLWRQNSPRLILLTLGHFTIKVLSKSTLKNISYSTRKVQPFIQRISKWNFARYY